MLKLVDFNIYLYKESLKRIVFNDKKLQLIATFYSSFV